MGRTVSSPNSSEEVAHKLKMLFSTCKAASPTIGLENMPLPSSFEQFIDSMDPNDHIQQKVFDFLVRLSWKRSRRIVQSGPLSVSHSSRNPNRVGPPSPNTLPRGFLAELMPGDQGVTYVPAAIFTPSE